MKIILSFVMIFISITSFGQKAYVALKNDTLKNKRGIPNAINKPDVQTLLFSHKNAKGEDVYIHPQDNMPVIKPNTAFVYTMPGAFKYNDQQEKKKPSIKLPSADQLDSLRKAILPKKSK